MKAEHRKELETNVLADKVGKIITTAKQGPSRGSILYVVFGVIGLVAIFLIYRWYITSAEQSSELWFQIEMGRLQQLNEVAKLAPEQYPGKAANFQMAWQELWFSGLKRLGGNPQLARESINKSKRKYEELAKECAGDPVFEPEALFALAAIEETSAIDNRENLTSAISAYKKVVESNKDSAFGKLAQKRIDELNDPIKLQETQRFYQDLQTQLRRQELPFILPGLKKKFEMPE